jgi:hypothetical protein
VRDNSRLVKTRRRKEKTGKKKETEKARAAMLAWYSS